VSRRKKLIKQDVNFLDYPNWVVRDGCTAFEIKTENGFYRLTTDYLLPTRLDKCLLYYLIDKVLTGPGREVVVSRYELCKYALGLEPGKAIYLRVEDALRRWKHVNVEYKGIFYEGTYTTRMFNIIDDVIIADGYVIIRFNEQYLEQLRRSKYCKYINFTDYQRLKKPVSARLYEILAKSFKDRDEWQIGLEKFCKKMTLVKQAPSQLLRLLRAAVSMINEKTNLKVSLSYHEKRRVLRFTKK